jgi:hypothetical protein
LQKPHREKKKTLQRELRKKADRGDGWSFGAIEDNSKQAGASFNLSLYEISLHLQFLIDYYSD